MAGCASAPLDQIHYFSGALDSVDAAGQPLLDDLAVAERQQGQRIASSSSAPDAACHQSSMTSGGGSVTMLLGFCNETSIYFADVAEPPGTAALRGGLAILRQYADLLIILAEARNVPDAVAHIGAVGQNVGQIISVLSGIPGPSVAIKAALSGIQPILEQAAQQLSVREAREVIISGAPKVTALIAALESAAPAMFATITAETRRRFERDDLHDPTAAEADKLRYDTYRRLVANYVALLRKLENAWVQTVQATEHPSPVTLAAVADQAGKLQADAESVRRIYSSLRSGTPPPGS